MNVFFDVQGTLVSGGTPRPHAREVFEELEYLGHHVYLWSSAGSAYAARAAKLLDLEDIVYGCFGKNDPVPVTVDFVVDDQPGIVGRYGGYEISPFDGDPDDRELYRAVESLR
ncbi:MAG: hypothetical protein M3157_04350 [Actinomycetota bacterium]|nr:hypothetical protein [Actinomycetota bacterium]